MCFISDGNVKAVSKYLRETTVHLKEERCTGGKTKIICSGGKFKHILNSSDNSSDKHILNSFLVFYGGDPKFSYTACQWIEAQAIETGKHIITKCVGMVESAW